MGSGARRPIESSGRRDRVGGPAARAVVAAQEPLALGSTRRLVHADVPPPLGREPPVLDVVLDVVVAVEGPAPPREREQERLQREPDHDRGQHQRLRDRDRWSPVSSPTIGGTPGRLPATTSSRLTPLPISPTPTMIRVRLRCSIE